MPRRLFYIQRPVQIAFSFVGDSLALPEFRMMGAVWIFVGLPLSTFSAEIAQWLN
jgi:hypothetical protein